LGLCRGTEKAKTSRRLVVPVQAFEAKRGGENTLSSGASPRGYVPEVVYVRLPRKALNTLNLNYLYPKPTQVGW
jgi:hypothetical protein